MKNLTDYLDKQIIASLLESAQFSEDDKEIVRAEIDKIIIANLAGKIAKELDTDEVLRFKTMIEKKSFEESVKIFEEVYKNSAKIQKAVDNYLTSELPAFILELVTEFAKNATGDQKQKFLELAK